jgi:hypothetical protein
MFKNWRFAVELKSLSVIQLKQPTDELLVEVCKEKL